MINVHKSKKKYGRSFFISKFKIIKESFDGFTYSTGNKKDVGVLIIETWHDIFRPYLTCRWRRGSVVDRLVGPGSLALTECRRRRTVRGENWGPRRAIGCRCHSGTGSETRCRAPSPVTHVVLQQDARFLTWLKDIWYFGIMWTQLSKDMSL